MYFYKKNFGVKNKGTILLLIILIQVEINNGPH